MDAKENGGLRRWLDKTLLAAIGLVALLVGTLWAITWERSSADIERVDLSQKDLFQRMTVSEVELKNIRQALLEIREDVKYIRDRIK